MSKSHKENKNVLSTHKEREIIVNTWDKNGLGIPVSYFLKTKGKKSYSFHRIIIKLKTVI